MQDLSLHILDIVENGIRAGARQIDIHVFEDAKRDRLEIEIRDDGEGMDPPILKKATDPFFTTKTTRRVGLGLSLLKEAAKTAGGDLSLYSVPGEGTTVTATFQLSHVDRKPMGELAKTLEVLMIAHPEIHFRFLHRRNSHENRIDSHETLTREHG